MKQLLLGAMCAVMFVVSAGCGPVQIKTGVSPVADIANFGGKVEQTGQEILQDALKARAATVQSQTVNPSAPTVVSAKAMIDIEIAVNKLGHGGRTLDDALGAYNAAKAAGGDVVKERAAVQAALKVVQDFLDNIGKALPTGTLQTIDILVNTIIDAVAQIKLGAGLPAAGMEVQQ